MIGIIDLESDCEMKNVEIVQKIIHTISNLTGKDVEELQKLMTFVKDRPGHNLR